MILFFLCSLLILCLMKSIIEQVKYKMQIYFVFFHNQLHFFGEKIDFLFRLMQLFFMTAAKRFRIHFIIHFDIQTHIISGWFSLMHRHVRYIGALFINVITSIYKRIIHFCLSFTFIHFENILHFTLI